MILIDTLIKKRIADESTAGKKLLRDYDEKNIKHCGYELRLGKVVSPKTGEVLSFEEPLAPPSAKRCVVLSPSELVLLVTKEAVNLPEDLCATYGQLNRLANQGLMILNTSIVEPGYDGQLSCVLVNFSSQQQTLSPNDPIAKLNFHEVQGKPTVRQHKFEGRYEDAASKNATALPKSLLDIFGVADRVSEKVHSDMPRNLKFGGIIIAVLLLWSQVEGVLSNWSYQRKQTDLTLQRVQLEYQKFNQ